MPKFTGALSQHPARISFISFASVILIGALLLALPVCRQPDANPIAFLDALFTSTSAVCVTGLTVRSTGMDFSWLGQLVIMLLIQVGGLGIMTITSFVTFTLGGRENLRHRAVISETLGAGPDTDLRWILRGVVLTTTIIEGIGAAILAIWFRVAHGFSWAEAAWQGVFHSIGAFCNAGFGLGRTVGGQRFENLEPYQGDWVINLTIILLIVFGGLGFPVILDIVRNWRGSWEDRWGRLMLHSKLMILGTAGLLTCGTLGFFVLEYDGDVMGHLPLHEKLLVSMFQSTTPRTAGFNTVDYAELNNATLLLTMLLMMIGAGPCSTGGGFKVSTFMVLIVRSWTTIQGFSRVQMFRRSMPHQTVEKAVATTLLFSIVAATGLTALLIVEQWVNPGVRFLDAAFEILSALGTVGLSMGLTSKLSAFGKIVIVAMMFIGRLGPFTVFVALSRSEREQVLEYASEEPLIG